MNALTPSFVMIQKYPLWEALSYDHPCVNNLKPVYIDKYDRNVKINTRPLMITTILLRQELLRKLETPEKEVQKMQLALPPASNIPIINLSNSAIKMEMEKPQYQSGPKTRFTGDELLNLDTSQNVDLVEDYIPVEEISLIAGQGDSGKSLFYLQICLSIVSGKVEFLGKKVTAKNKSALIISTEDNEKKLSIRIRKQVKKLGGDKAALKNLVIQTTGEDLITLLKSELIEKRFDLVVLDALGDLLLDDSNSQTAVRAFYAELEKLIREFKCAFLLVHHEGKSAIKSGKSKIIGSVAIVDRARSVIMLSKDLKTAIRTLTIVKSNNLTDDKKGKALKLKLDTESLTYYFAGDYDVTIDIDAETSKAASKSKVLQSTSSTSKNVSSNSRKNKPGRKLDEAKVKDAFDMYKQGLTLEEIGTMLDRDKATISRWLKKYH